MSRDRSDERSNLPHVTIHVLRGKATTASRVMKGRSLLIGSGPQCDIHMRSPDVAPKHALLARDPEGVKLRQLDTDHPVYVNDQSVTDVMLKTGDKLRVGPFELSISVEGGTATSAASPAPTKAEPAAGAKLGLDRAMQTLSQLTQTNRSSEPASPAHRPSPAAAEPDREIERKRRQLREEAHLAESNRSQLKQERIRFDLQRSEIEQKLKNLAEKEALLSQQENELQQRSHKILEREQELSRQQERTTEESIDIDQRRETYERERRRLHRIHQKVVQQYREKHQHLSAMAEDLERRAADFEKNRAAHESEIAHWRRLADDVGRRQAEVRRLDADVQKRCQLLDRREAELRERQSRFEADLAEVRSKDQSLDSVRAELEQRRQRLAEEEGLLRQARQSVQEQLERAKRRSAEIQQRHDELDAHRAILEQQAEELKSQADEIERDRQLTLDYEPEPSTERFDRAPQPTVRRPAEPATATLPPLIVHQMTESIKAAFQASAQRSGELEHHWQARLNEEADWSKELASREQRLTKQLEKVDREHGLLDQAETKHQRRGQKLSELTGRWLGQSPTLDRRVETLRESDDAKSQRLTAEKALRDEQRQAIRSRLDQILGEQELTLSLRDRWSADHAQLQAIARWAESQLHVVTKKVQSADPSVAPAAVKEFEATMAEWNRIIEDQQTSLDERQAHIQREAASQHAFETEIMTNPTTAVTIQASANAADASTEESEEEIAQRLVDAKLVELPRLTWLKQSTRGRSISLQDEMIRQGLVTPYQWDRAAQEEWDELKLGNDLVLDILHDGAVATTYKIQPAGRDVPLTLRLLKALWSKDPAQRKQYEILVDSFTSVAHPAIVGIVGTHRVGDRFGVLSQFVDAVSLAEMIPTGVPSSALLSIIFHAAAGLEAAERAGFLHLSLRPSRILLAKTGEVRVTGFAEPDWLRKIHRCEKGKLGHAYVAPESLAPGPAADSRADVYSLARILLDASSQSVGVASASDPFIRETFGRDLAKLLEQTAAPIPADRPRPADLVRQLEPFVDPFALLDWPDLALRFESDPAPSPRRIVA